MSKIIDLTHTLSSEIPGWDLGCKFELETTVDYKDCTPPNLFRVQKINMLAQMGTHMDAPAHCVPGAATIDTIEVEDLVTDCVVIRVPAGDDENYLVKPEVIEKFEKENGEIKPNTFVIFYTGWGKHWNNKDKYRNDLKFPSISKEAAEFLLERDIAGIGIDTLSPDSGEKDFPVHQVMLGRGLYIVENVLNREDMPAVGAKIHIMPLKIKDGTESPIRLVAFV